MKLKKSSLYPLVGVALLLTAVLLLTWHFQEPALEFIQGEVEAKEVDVSSKVPGRISKILVKEGSSVNRNELLAVLEFPEIQAKLEQADAARDAAQAQQEKADHGARKEEILAAKSLWLEAGQATQLLEKTYRRLQVLYDDGVVPAQRRDEAEAKWKASMHQTQAARSAYEMAESGARQEDKEAAAALARQAEGAVREVESVLKESHLKAPRSGEVAEVLVEPGELVSAGFPIITLVDLTDIWVAFNMREDRLADMRMGTELTADIPALGNHSVKLKVDYIAPLGDFATWRATSASGGFDLKTFEVRARPMEPVEGLRPGMSALVPVNPGREKGR